MGSLNTRGRGLGVQERECESEEGSEVRAVVGCEVQKGLSEEERSKNCIKE